MGDLVGLGWLARRNRWRAIAAVVASSACAVVACLLVMWMLNRVSQQLGNAAATAIGSFIWD